MSAETMIGFVEKLESDAGIREEFETALGSTEDTDATVIEFASQHGFEVTEEDCRALAAAAAAAEGELDDDALEGVAGGVNSDQETVRNRRQMNATSFENADQKSTQLFNMLNSVMKSQNSMMTGIVRKLR